MKILSIIIIGLLLSNCTNSYVKNKKAITSPNDLIKLTKSCVEYFSLSIFTTTFLLPEEIVLPIPQKTKGIIIIPKSTFA